MKIFLLIITITIIATGCINQMNEIDTTHYFQEGEKLIKKVYYPNGKLKIKKSYTLDTLGWGHEYNYYENGKIEKYKWFELSSNSKGNDFPKSIIYYDTNGVYQDCSGSPFIELYHGKHNKTIIKLVNYPYYKHIVIYRDSFDNKCVDALVYEPLITDTTSLVGIEPLMRNKNHKYYATYYLLDSLNHLVDSIKIRLYNEYNWQELSNEEKDRIVNPGKSKELPLISADSSTWSIKNKIK